MLARGRSVYWNSRGHLGARTAASQKHTPVHFRHRGGPTLCVRHDGSLALETTRNGGKRLVRFLPVPGDGELDAVHRPADRRRTEYRDRVGPGRGERGNNRAGLPPLVPGGFGL